MTEKRQRQKIGGKKKRNMKNWKKMRKRKKKEIKSVINK